MSSPANGNWVTVAPAGSGFASGATVDGGPGFVGTGSVGTGFVDPKSIPDYGSLNLTYGSTSYSYGSMLLLAGDYPRPGSSFTDLSPATGSFGPGGVF